MYFRTKYRSLLFYKQIYFSFFNIMPFYAVVFRTSKSGTVAGNWDVARGLRDGTPNSYAKKFDSQLDAEKYIKDFNFKIVNKTDNTNNNFKGVKRKRFEIPNNPIISVADHLKRIKEAFNDLQVAVSSFSGLSSTCADQIQILNNEVLDKLNQILTINETESTDVSLAIPVNAKLSHGRLLSSDHKVSSSSNIDGTGFLPSELEAAKKSFKLNEKNEVVVYTDGACSNNGQNGASAGAGVWFGNNHPLNLSVKVPGTQTNNNAEIFSIIKAIELVKATGLNRISIYTDSDFVIKSVNEWMPSWKVKGWKTSSGSTVKNKEMFILLNQKIASMRSVSWTHVAGHKGIIGNEEADKLARLGAKLKV